jgi:hypothetical protein
MSARKIGQNENMNHNDHWKWQTTHDLQKDVMNAFPHIRANVSLSMSQPVDLLTILVTLVAIHLVSNHDLVDSIARSCLPES